MEKRDIERGLIIIALLFSLAVTIKLQLISLPLITFIWAILFFYFINFWLYQKKEQGLFFALPLALTSILTVQIGLSAIAWITGTEIFHDDWAMIFAWPSLVVVITTTLYILFILDKGLRNDVKYFFYFKKLKKTKIFSFFITYLWCLETRKTITKKDKFN